MNLSAVILQPADRQRKGFESQKVMCLPKPGPGVMLVTWVEGFIFHIWPIGKSPYASPEDHASLVFNVRSQLPLSRRIVPG